MRITQEFYDSLFRLHERRAKHQSHLNFVLACLSSNVTPTGLEIKKNLSVLKGANEGWLTARWSKTLRKTSGLLLRLLKNYHRMEILALSDQIQQGPLILPKTTEDQPISGEGRF